MISIYIFRCFAASATVQVTGMLGHQLSNTSKNKKDEKPSVKRRSNERRKHARFMAICCTCSKIFKSTTAEISSFVSEHMCYSDPEIDDTNVLDQSIQYLQDLKKKRETEAKSRIDCGSSPSSILTGQQKPDLSKTQCEDDSNVQTTPPSLVPTTENDDETSK